MARADLLTASIPWYRTISREQWRAFFATFLGWVIDAFDYNILAFVLICYAIYRLGMRHWDLRRLQRRIAEVQKLERRIERAVK